VTNILLIMYRQFLAETLESSLRSKPEFKVYKEYDYQNAALAAKHFKPNIVVVEVPESHARQTQDYLIICKTIQEIAPDCKLLLIYPENSPESKRHAIEASQEGIISDFLFYDTSLDYFITKLEALSSRNGR